MNASSPQMANAIRALAMDAVQQANSGHPGMPMGMADMAVALWRDHLRHNPTDPAWPDRDRFVVSNGHGSMLLYALLHLSGYDLPMSELRQFRQLHSKTPVTPRSTSPPGWRPPLARSARASPTQLAWRLPSDSWQQSSIAQATPWSIITPMSFWETAASWKASVMRPAALRASGDFQS